MNRLQLPLILMAGALLGGLLVGRPAPEPVGAQPPLVSTRWEYAELSSLPKAKTWATPGKTVTANTWEELMKKLGVKGDTHFTALLNRFGSEGWELATHSATAVNSSGVIITNEHWTFKRPTK